MWSRLQFKTRAKELLGRNYWQAFVVALVLAFVGGISLTPLNSGGAGGGHGNGVTFDLSSGDFKENLSNLNPFHGLGSIATGIRHAVLNDGVSVSESMTQVIFPLIAMASVIILLAMIIFRVFLGYPLEVGCRSFFLNAQSEKERLSDIVSRLKQDGYWSILSAMFLRAVYTFLWTLLLIIPGIVMGYAYKMVPYILAENPNLTANEAISLSKQMTLGYKSELFIMDLSFIGWYLLGLIACGLGGVFVNPYYLTTEAEAYTWLRDRALNLNLIPAHYFPHLEASNQ